MGMNENPDALSLAAGGHTSNSLVIEFPEKEPLVLELQRFYRGMRGLPGDVGASAYEVAVQNGYEGTEEEWLLSLRGDTGGQGEDGLAGADGLSAYQVALENGFEGTQAEWLLSLKGDPGEQGEPGEPGGPGGGADGPPVQVAAGSMINLTVDAPGAKWIILTGDEETQIEGFVIEEGRRVVLYNQSNATLLYSDAIQTPTGDNFTLQGGEAMVLFAYAEDQVLNLFYVPEGLASQLEGMGDNLELLTPNFGDPPLVNDGGTVLIPLYSGKQVYTYNRSSSGELDLEEGLFGDRNFTIFLHGSGELTFASKFWFPDGVPPDLEGTNHLLRCTIITVYTPSPEHRVLVTAERNFGPA